jgi:TolB protein
MKLLGKLVVTSFVALNACSSSITSTSITKDEKVNVSNTSDITNKVTENRMTITITEPSSIKPLIKEEVKKLGIPEEKLKFESLNPEIVIIKNDDIITPQKPGTASINIIDTDTNKVLSQLKVNSELPKDSSNNVTNNTLLITSPTPSETPNIMPTKEPEPIKLKGKLLFAGMDGIYLKDLTTLSEKRLIHTNTCFYPSISPDKTKIIFTKLGGSSLFNVYVMNADGTGEKQLTFFSTRGLIPFATWSPDGNKIALRYSNQLYLMNSDGSEQKVFRDALSTFTQSKISWLADSSGIIFDFEPVPNTNIDIYTYKFNTKEITRLTNSSALDIYPSVSPDGKKIVFISYQTGTSELYIMNIDGTGQKKLTETLPENPIADTTWTPDGKNILFSKRTYNEKLGEDLFSIFSITTEGKDLNQLTCCSNKGNPFVFYDN